MSSSPLQISTSPVSAISSSGHWPPPVMVAASDRAIVVFPVPGAPASTWNLPRANHPGHSQRTATGMTFAPDMISTAPALSTSAALPPFGVTPVDPTSGSAYRACMSRVGSKGRLISLTALSGGSDMGGPLNDRDFRPAQAVAREGIDAGRQGAVAHDLEQTVETRATFLCPFDNYGAEHAAAQPSPGISKSSSDVPSSRARSI